MKRDLKLLYLYIIWSIWKRCVWPAARSPCAENVLWRHPVKNAIYTEWSRMQFEVCDGNRTYLHVASPHAQQQSRELHEKGIANDVRASRLSCRLVKYDANGLRDFACARSQFMLSIKRRLEWIKMLYILLLMHNMFYIFIELTELTEYTF